MRIAHISDLHFTTFSSNPLKLFSKRVLGMLNYYFFRKKNFSLKPLESLPQLLQEKNIDLLLISGDFTTSSLEKEFLLAKKWLSNVKIPFLAIPGNHDKYTKESERQQTFYQYFTCPFAKLGSLKSDGVEAHQIKENFWVVSLDTAVATTFTSSQGLFSESLEKKLIEILDKIPANDRVIMLNHYPLFQNEKPRRSLKRSEHLENLLKKYPKVFLYLHGHTHRRCMIDLRAANLPIILDSGCASLLKYSSCNFLELGQESLNIEVYQWQSTWQRIQHKEFLWTI